MRIYLAGGFHGGWQDEVMTILGNQHLYLDPRSWQTTDPREYTELDLAAIKSSDRVIVYMDSSNPSGYGLSIEIGFAFALNKPIIFIDGMKLDWRSKYFDMARQLCTVCSSFEAVKERL